MSLGGVPQVLDPVNPVELGCLLIEALQPPAVCFRDARNKIRLRGALPQNSCP